MSNKIKVIIRQQTFTTKYYRGYGKYPLYSVCCLGLTEKELVTTKGTLVSDDEIATIECSKDFISLIKEKSVIYLTELDNQAEVINMLPQSDGNYLCYIRDKMIPTEETVGSLLKAYSEIEEEKDEEIKALKARIDEHPYKHRWFNFKK